MGAEQLTGVMESITRESARRAGRKVDEEEIGARMGKMREGVEGDSRAYKLSSYLHDDGIIDPRDTRDVLGMCLEVVKSEPVQSSPGSHHLARL